MRILLLCGVALMLLSLNVTLLVPTTPKIKGFPVLILQGAWYTLTHFRCFRAA